MDYEKILRGALNDKSVPFEVLSWIEEKFPGIRDSEDEKIRKELIHFVKSVTDGYDYLCADGSKVSDVLAWLEKQGDTQKKTDYAYQKGYDDGLRVNLEMQGEPKPAEWSKEDEQYLLVCKNALAKYQTTDKWDASIILHWLENKLKSLRSQSQWKPSEEQIEALEHFVRSVSESGYASPYDNNTKLLYSLLSDLKKLKD